MPARKPLSLHADYGHRTRYDDRAEAEKAATPEGKLPEKPPGLLRNNPVARSEWRKVTRLFNELDAVILSKLDLGMLEQYCLLRARFEDQAGLRDKARAIMAELAKRYESEEATLQEKIDLLKPMHGVQADLNKLDMTLNSTGRLLMDYAKALYLLPRSRGAVTPPLKSNEEPSEMDKLLDEVAMFGDVRR